MAKRQTVPSGQQSHISHRQPRTGGKFAKASPTVAEPLPAAPGAVAPNAGRAAVPHAATFQGLIQAVSGKRVYMPADTAVQWSRYEADRMLLDPAVKGPLDERFRGTSLAAWHIEADDKDDAEQTAMAATLTRIVKKIPRFRKYIHWLLYAEFHGRSAINNVFDFFDDGDKRYCGVTRWTVVHGDKLAFSSDGSVGVKIGAAIPLWMMDKIDTSVLGRVYWFDTHTRPLYTIHKGEIRDGLYEDVWSAGSIDGLGVRHHIFPIWWRKMQAEFSMMDALERYSCGLNLWYFTSGDEKDMERVRKMAEAQSGMNNLLVPRSIGDDKQGPGVQHIEMAGEGLKYVKEIMREYFDAQIRQMIVGQELSSKAASTGLGSGVADLQKDTKSDIIKADALSLGDTLTDELLMPLARFNWPGVPCRCHFLFDVDDSQRQELLTATKMAWDMGMPIDEDDLRSNLGLAKPEPGANVLRKGGSAVQPADGADKDDDGDPAAGTLDQLLDQ